MAEIEAAFKRISAYKGVMGVIVIGKGREGIRTSLSVSGFAQLSLGMQKKGPGSHPPAPPLTGPPCAPRPPVADQRGRIGRKNAVARGDGPL